MRSGMEVLEEAVDLLRRTPASAWAWYLAGAVPFFGAVLVFQARMTGVTAVPNPLGGALALALLFGWRQYTRAWFASELYGMLAGSERRRHSLRALSAVWVAGTARIPLLIVPFPALIAWFRNVSVMAVREADVFSRAGALAERGSEQLVPLLTVAGSSIVIWINVFMGMVLLPALIQLLTGQDLAVLRNGEALVNSTTVCASLIVAWCIVDAVLTAFYTLRVFYGESEATGADLLARWRRAVSRAAVAMTVVCLLIPAAHAEKPLRQAVDQVLTEAPYRWREPLPAATEQNAFVRWTDRILAGIEQGWEAVKRGIARFFDWLKNLFDSAPAKKSDSAAPKVGLSVFAWLVIVVLAGALVALLMRASLRPSGKAPAAPAGPPAIDLEDPNVLASQLPENEWVAMARDFAARGEHRMALRAYFLATVAFLASRELLVVGRSKTNLDYLSEVRRRARSVSGLDGLFAGGVRVFESAWYGLREVSGSELEIFAANFERLRALVGGS